MEIYARWGMSILMRVVGFFFLNFSLNWKVLGVALSPGAQWKCNIISGGHAVAFKINFRQVGALAPNWRHEYVIMHPVATFSNFQNYCRPVHHRFCSPWLCLCTSTPGWIETIKFPTFVQLCLLTFALKTFLLRFLFFTAHSMLFCACMFIFILKIKSGDAKIILFWN